MYFICAFINTSCSKLHRDLPANNLASVIIQLFIFAAVECGYPPVKDDVVVKGSNFTYSSEGVLLRCKRSKEQRRQKPVQINCLSNSSWSVQEFSCSGNVRQTML